MKTPEKICLIDVGDEVTWCDSVPCDNIDETDVVFYIKQPAFDAVSAELADLKDYYAYAMRDPCEDEIHCTCYPGMKKRAENAEAERDERYKQGVRDGINAAIDRIELIRNPSPSGLNN